MLQRMAFFVLVALVGAVGSVEASSTARADFDGSGRIDSADYALFYDAYGTMVGQDVFHPKFDLDADGVVGISDWMLFVDEWGKTTSAADTETDDILAARSDFDGTGLVDGLDYLLLITALKADFNLLFDLNADESVDMLDRDLFVEDWGKTVPKDLIPLCDRTPEVRDEILRLLGAGNTCDSVTRTALLALKDTLHLQDSGITALKVDDFAGLDSIRVLLLDNNALTTIEPHAFDSLKTIRRMYLRDNAITSIADSVFVNLDSLRTVDVTGNPGEPFPLRFSIKRLDARPASMARPAEIAIQVPFKVPKPFGLLFTARVENIGHGLYKKLTIPVRDTSVVFTFDTFETEESGWGYRGSDSNDPPYLLSIREHNLSSALRYGQNSYGGTYYGTYTKGGRGFYGFKAVTDSLCIYSEDCNSVIYRRTYAGGGSVPRGSGGGGGGTTTTPGTGNPGSGGTTTTPGTGNPGTGGTTTTPGTGNPGSGTSTPSPGDDLRPNSISFAWSSGLDTAKVSEGSRSFPGIVIATVNGVSTRCAPEDLTLRFIPENYSARRFLWLGFPVDGGFSHRTDVSVSKGYCGVIRPRSFVFYPDFDTDPKKRLVLSIGPVNKGPYEGLYTDLDLEIEDTWPNERETGASLTLNPSRVMAGISTEVQATIRLQRSFPRQEVVLLHVRTGEGDNLTERPILDVKFPGQTYPAFIAFDPGETVQRVTFDLFVDDNPDLYDATRIGVYWAWKGDEKHTYAASPLSNSKQLLGEAPFTVERSPAFDLFSGKPILSPKDSLEIKDPSTRRSVSVRLPARPDEAVTVTIPGDDPDFTISESELVFTPSNWSRSQSVTFTISPSFKYSSWSFGFAVSSDDRRFNGLFVPYVVYGQIPDQPSTITFTSNTNENFRNSVNRFSDNHWGDYAGLTSVTRQSGSDRHLKGFRYFLETIRGIRIPIEKFEEYAHTACVFFGTDAVTGTGSLSSPVKGTWDAAEGYWKLSEEVIITDLEPEHTSNRFQIRIRKNCN